MSSSQNFGSRVQTLLGQKSLQRSVPSLFPISRPPLSKVLTTPRSPSSPKLPTDADAHRYLDAVAFYIGHSQYHFDPREFCDKLAFFYANLDDEAQKHSLWYLQLLLVLAIGKLFLGELDGEQVPGRSMFDYAVDILPNLSEMQSHGVLGIEVLALVAVYLQNADRKEEAYVYVGSWIFFSEGSLFVRSLRTLDQHGFTFSYFARITSPFNHQTLVKIGERSYKSTVVDHIHARKAGNFGGCQDKP
jgi:proline utilization trans-activator